MTYPSFSVGEVLTAADMNAVGLWLVKTQTVGTAVSSVTVSNAFSANYDNYRIIWSGGSGSATGSVYLQLSASTGSTYQTSGYFMTPGTATLNPYSPAATTRWLIGNVNTTRCQFVADLFDPFASRQTFGVTSANTTTSYYTFGLLDTSTASSTGFTIGHDTAGQTITGGTIRVYGYRN